MSNRVLNFSEFNTKYSSETSTPANASDMANAAANFEEGFDDSTYDQPQIGPNRPVSGNYDITPASSGIAFNENPSDDMNAPAEGDDQNWPGAMAEAGEEDANEPEEVEEDEEDDDEGNPENEEIVEESYSVVKGFIQFVNESKFNLFKRKSKDPEAAEAERKRVESFWNDPDYNIPEETYEECTDCNGKGCVECNYEGHVPLKDDNTYGMNPDSYEDDESFCSGCGAVGDKYGYNCGCNM